jgi:urease accessory protein
MFAVISRSSAAIHTGITEDASLQRSRGVLDLVISNRDGVSRGERVFQQGALKVRFPNVEKAQPMEAVVLNTAGGLTGGDRLDLAFRVGEHAGATITSQACEKVYRALDDPAQVSVKISLEAGAAMHWLPQPTIFFDGARLRRETQVNMASDATLLAIEGVIFGRAAMGEIVSTGSLSDAWLIKRGERLIQIDRFDAGGDIRALLDKVTVLNGNRAMATMRYIAPDAEKRLDEMRALLADAACPAAASAWDGLMVVRVVAADGYTLVRELMRMLGAFRSTPMPRVWSM